MRTRIVVLCPSDVVAVWSGGSATSGQSYPKPVRARSRYWTRPPRCPSDGRCLVPGRLKQVIQQPRSTPDIRVTRAQGGCVTDSSPIWKKLAVH